MLYFSNTDQKPSEKKILRKIKDENNKVWTITRVPNYFVGEIPAIYGRLPD